MSIIENKKIHDTAAIKDQVDIDFKTNEKMIKLSLTDYDTTREGVLQRYLDKLTSNHRIKYGV